MADTLDTDTPRSLRARRRLTLPIVIAVVFVLGVGILLYPAAASWFTQLGQSERIAALSDRVNEMSPSARERALANARAYNATLLGGGASVAAHERLPLADQSEQAGDYHALLRADSYGLMARIKIPRIDVDLPIYHGTSDAVLDRAVGHLEGTALPVGGDSTHAVLTAHRGLADAELFSNLDRVDVDDTFTIEVFGEVLAYRVVHTMVVQPEETETLHPQRGRDLVTLVTCTPLGINSHRILVTAERILPTPVEDIENAGKPPNIPGFPWWAVILSGAVLLSGGYVVYAARSRRSPGGSHGEERSVNGREILSDAPLP